MPTLDSEGRVVGMVLREVKESMNYTPCYLVLTLSSHMLRMYPPEAAVSVILSTIEFEVSSC